MYFPSFSYLPLASMILVELNDKSQGLGCAYLHKFGQLIYLFQKVLLQQ